MISGRDLQDPNVGPPKEVYRKLFSAKVIRDASMANKINNLIFKSKSEDNYLVICGNEHMAYNFGVPELIWRKNN